MRRLKPKKENIQKLLTEELTLKKTLIMISVVALCLSLDIDVELSTKLN